jgi:hypothetical protein
VSRELDCASTRTPCRGCTVAAGLACLLAVVLLWPSVAGAREPLKLRPSVPSLLPGADAWRATQVGTIRGVTVGPIENGLHASGGYGTEAFARAVREIRLMGGNWVSLTPFGRVWDLQPAGIARDFEQPFVTNRAAMLAAIELAHAEGLRVLLVPHLWVETGGWRGELELGDEAAWSRFARDYEEFAATWAKVAQEGHVDMMAAGVELRSWLTTTRAPSFERVVQRIRREYDGLVTYAGNWDDIEQTVILQHVDVIGLNAFFPLAQKEGASFEELVSGAGEVATRLEGLASRWQKPVMFCEFGYTNRRDPALRPWEWPEHLGEVSADEQAQADAYQALLAPLLERPWFAGFFVWRTYSNPDDVSQEPEWGFSPRGKRAELILRDAFTARWAADGPYWPGSALVPVRARRIGDY